MRDIMPITIKEFMKETALKTATLAPSNRLITFDKVKDVPGAVRWDVAVTNEEFV